MIIMVYKIFRAHTFDKKLEKFEKEFVIWVDKMEDQLIENPYVGDPIRVSWFREKKYGRYRIYYLIYDDIEAVYIVGISDKDDQQVVINTIWLLLDNFHEEIKKLVEK